MAITRLFRSVRMTLPLTLLVGAGVLAPPATARAQSLLGADPYRPYYGGYEASALPPSAARNFNAADEMARDRSYATRANQMNQFYEELYGPGGATAGPGGRSVPSGGDYNNANRALDRQLGRTYVPNNTPADRAFYRDQDRRAQDYFAALAEKDPKKRAEKLRAIELENLRSARNLASSNRGRQAGARAASPRARGTTAAGSAATGARAPQARGTPATTAPRATGTPATPPATGPGPRIAPRDSTLTTPPASPGTAAPAPGAFTPGTLRRPSARSRLLTPSLPPLQPSTTVRRSETPSQTLERALRSDASAGLDAEEKEKDEAGIAPLVPRRPDRTPPAGYIPPR